MSVLETLQTALVLGGLLLAAIAHVRAPRLTQEDEVKLRYRS